MKKYKIIFLATVVLFAASCDLLDRPQLNLVDDDTFWTSEEAVRLFANEFYPQFFVAYNSSWTVDYTPLRGMTFNDDVVSAGMQLNFPTEVPAIHAGVNATATNAPAWLGPEWAGPRWFFGWIRKANLMIDRVETRMRGDVLTDERADHWVAVARFFRALDYCRLVSVYGNVPWFDREVDISDRNMLFKDRDPRNYVMDRIYEDFRFALENLQAHHQTVHPRQDLNQDIAAAFISRWMLFEGTWQWYHYQNTERATRFLNFAVYAANRLITSGRFEIDMPMRTLFGSQSLVGAREPVMFRTYATGMLTHHIASFSNPYFAAEQLQSANLNLIKSFIAHDGEVWQNSSVADADQFDLQNLIVTRDPRFEATFHNVLHSPAAALLWTSKFIARTMRDEGHYTSFLNNNDGPVIRFGEVLLNWIEARAVLYEMGTGPAVTPADINISINALRDRPLDAVAIARGVQQAAHMTLPIADDFDPARDQAVSALMWEIRRERRMEMHSEPTRLLDLRRWRKLHYMDGEQNPTILRGIWVDIPNEIPGLIRGPGGVATGVGTIKVDRMDGSPIIVFDGTNDAEMVGFFVPANIENRPPPENRHYLAPVPQDQITLYRQNQMTLSQTRYW